MRDKRSEVLSRLTRGSVTAVPMKVLHRCLMCDETHVCIALMDAYASECVMMYVNA